MSEPSSFQPSLLGRAAMDAKAPGAFRTISEVATDLNVQQHVLRFWESKFPQVKPLKRGGGRRYYRPEDVALLNSIKDMLYNQGFTIRGVQKLLREGGRSPIARMTGNDAPASAAPTGTLSAFSSPRGLSTEKRRQVESVLSELKAMRDLLRNGGL